MKQPGVAELKARLSEYLKLVKSGHEVLIKERGMPIAKIVPLDAAERRSSRMERLIKAGLLIPAKGRMPRSLLHPRPASRQEEKMGESVLAALLEDREQGR